MTTHKKKPEVRSLEAGAEETRAKIGENLEALGDKLSPQNIKEEIKTEAKQALGDAKDAAVDKLRDVKETVTEAGRATASFAGQNALPLALIGAGVGWLLATRPRDGGWRRRYEFRGEPRWGREQVERAEHLMHEGAEKGREFAGEAREQLRHAGERTRDFARESPLAVGAMALAAGVGVGLLFPTTRKEDELLGPARDRLVEGARDTAEQIGATAKQTASEVKEKVRETMVH